MKNLTLFIELTRLKKPIGFMLLFWPCIWGLSLSYDFKIGIYKFIFYAILFLLGSILMRSAGCIINDIADRNIDKKVKRTKNRPIASGKVSIKLALIYSAILCALAFLVLINFNSLTIFLAILSMPLAFTYPYIKRFSYWPQLFLGVTFNYGLLLGWASINEQLNFAPIVFYFGAIFWTLGYDTIYGYQDIEDDEIIGVKSTSIKFKGNPKKFLTTCYLLFFISLIITGITMGFSVFFYLMLLLVFYHLFFFQIKKLEIKNPVSCNKMFKSNNFFGLILLIAILTEKLI